MPDEQLTDGPPAGAGADLPDDASPEAAPEPELDARPRRRRLNRRRRARPQREPVPAALFSDARLPAFMLFDEMSRELSTGSTNAAGGTNGTVYVSEDDGAAFARFLMKHLHSITSDEEITRQDVAWTIYRALTIETTAVVEGPAGKFSAGTLGWLAHETANFVLEDPEAFAFLDAIVGSAYATVSHAVDTALYAVAIAVGDHVQDEEALQAIVLAGLFADAGKLALPESLLNKEGPLDEEQWRLMKRHPQGSVEYMHKAGIVSRRAQQAVLHHHERWDGTGYPERLLHHAIPMEARYVAIADSYAALTVDRLFRERRDPYQAVVEMLTTRGQFEPRLLRIFVPLLLVEDDDDHEERIEDGAVA